MTDAGLEAIRQRILWLAVPMVDDAKDERPVAGGIRVAAFVALG